jgi:hypothetical protein
MKAIEIAGQQLHEISLFQVLFITVKSVGGQSAIFLFPSYYTLIIMSNLIEE